MCMRRGEGTLPSTAVVMLVGFCSEYGGDGVAKCIDILFGDAGDVDAA